MKPDWDNQFAETEDERNERLRAARLQKIPTRYIVMRADQPHETYTIFWPKAPGYDQIRQLIEPIIDGDPLEHVAVLADFSGGTNYKPLDMFVSEIGHVKKLPLKRNEAATLIYRRANLLGMTGATPASHPEVLPWIAGPAILFDRLVWF